MRKFYFGKVIRDKVLAAMEEEGCEIEYRRLQGDERQAKLTEKLVEESHEVAKATDRDDFLEELADAQVVIDTLVGGLAKDDRRQFERLHQAKLDEKGGFNDYIWVETVTVHDDSEWISYFESKPEKYPELK